MEDCGRVDRSIGSCGLGRQRPYAGLGHIFRDVGTRVPWPARRLLGTPGGARSKFHTSGVAGRGEGPPIPDIPGVLPRVADNPSAAVPVMAVK
jgi:hypothetical protein